MKDTINEIKDIIKKGTTVFGTEQTFKAAKNGKLKKAFVSSNCDKDIEEDLTKYSKIGNFELIKLNISNHDLGTTAKKPFSISIIGVLK